jgi:hypothetical protein
MWRPAHGATTRPGPCRPMNGYGRAVGRPEPRSDGPVEHEALGGGALEPSMFEPPPAPAGTDVEAPAITP